MRQVAVRPSGPRTGAQVGRSAGRRESAPPEAPKRKLLSFLLSFDLLSFSQSRCGQHRSRLPKLDVGDPEIEQAAIRALAQLDPSRATKLLIRKLHSPNSEVVKATIDVLAKLKAREAVPSLIELLDSYSAAYAALATITGIHPPKNKNLHRWWNEWWKKNHEHWPR